MAYLKRSTTRQTNQSKFGDIFQTWFNLSFIRPEVDVYSYCEDLSKRINANIEKQENIALLQLHLVRAE